MKKLVILLIGILFLSECADSQIEENKIIVEEAENEAASYTQIAVKCGSIKSEVSISCQYAPKEKINCAFTGQEREIVEILVEKGDFVEEGDYVLQG